jgi:hypothetical protein
MAVVSLILGLLGGGLLGIGFGIAALQAVKAGRATNRTLAVWAIVLNCTMWIVYIVGFGVLTAISAALAPPVALEPGGDPFPDAVASDLVPVTEIPLGTCFLEPELQGGYYYGVEVVSCDEPHDSQAYAVGTLAEQAYVSEEHMGDIAWDICFTDESTASLQADIAADLYADVYYPGLDSWNQGDRGYVCFVWDERGPLSNSVLAADLETYDGD